MGVSEEKEMVYAILVSEDRIKNLKTEGAGYLILAFPEQLVVEGPTTISVRDKLTLNNLTYEQVVKSQHKNVFNSLKKPEANAQFLDIFVKVIVERTGQNFPDEEYSRVWKVIEGPMKGRFKKTATKILAIGIYKK